MRNGSPAVVAAVMDTFVTLASSVGHKNLRVVL